MYKIIILFLIVCTATTQAMHNPHWAEETLNILSTREKIGQLFMVSTTSNSEAIEASSTMAQSHIEHLIKNYHIGGLIFLYKSTPELQIQKTNHYQALSKLPLLIGQDCEWGLSMRLYQTIRFPRNMTLGAISDKDLIYKLGQEIGNQCAAIGVHINFAPVADVNNNPNNPVINDRSFGENKNLVAQYAQLMMRGLQDAGVIGCAKHFPGHGDTATDSHHALPTIMHNRDRLNSIELYPFAQLIHAGVKAVMNAHLAIPALDDTLPSSLSRKIVTDILKKELGFQGLVITDGMGMKAITQHYAAGDAELKALLAGHDIILCPTDVPAAVELIEQALNNQQLSEQELNSHVLKILQAKQDLALDKNRFVELEYALASLHSPHALLLKKKLYQAAITLVHNKNTIVPLVAKTLEAALVQIGGQRDSVFEKTLEPLDLKTFYSHENLVELLEPYTTIIMGVFGMHKFANKNFGLSTETLELINTLTDQNKKIILTLFGSPYSLKFFDKQDAVIMAYEDDEDAQEAAAHVIMGKLLPTGKLPVYAI